MQPVSIQGLQLLPLQQQYHMRNVLLKESPGMRKLRRNERQSGWQGMCREQARTVTPQGSDIQMPEQMRAEDDDHTGVRGARPAAVPAWHLVLHSGVREEAETQGHARAFLARLHEHGCLLQPVRNGQGRGKRRRTVAEAPASRPLERRLPGLLAVQGMPGPVLEGDQAAWQRLRPQVRGLRRQAPRGDRGPQGVPGGERHPQFQTNREEGDL